MINLITHLPNINVKQATTKTVFFAFWWLIYTPIVIGLALVTVSTLYKSVIWTIGLSGYGIIGMLAACALMIFTKRFAIFVLWTMPHDDMYRGGTTADRQKTNTIRLIYQ